MSQLAHWQSTLRQQFDGNGVLTASSERLSWSGLSLQHYDAQPAIRGEITLPCATLIAFLNETPVALNRRALSGPFVRELRPAGVIKLLQPGPVPSIRSFTRISMIACGIDREVLDEVKAEDTDRGAAQQRRAQRGDDLFSDAALSTLLRLLYQEAACGGPTGQLYIDSLADALALRTLFLLSGIGKRIRPAPRLSGTALRRVLDLLEDLPARNHDLASLAAQAGCSRTHLLRAFAGTTGMTPHQFLIRTRLREAARLLRETSMPLEEIAARCGFSHGSHLSRLFVRQFGAPPAQFRRIQKMSRAPSGSPWPVLR